MDGETFKVTEKNFFCNYGAYAIGIKAPDQTI